MATLPITVPVRTGSVIVAGLTSPSAYIDSFFVEVYADAALTDLVAQQTAGTAWNGTANVQAQPLTFSGLPVTSQYWIRVGTGSSQSPIISWSDAMQVQLSVDSALDGIRYGGTYTATSSGVSYQAIAVGAPSNVDHYEAIYTINDSTVPLSTATPHWRGVPDVNGLLTFGAVGAPGQFIRAYMRAVDTSLNYQTWFLISTLQVTSTGGVGNLDQLPDGSTYARTKASGLTNGVPDPRKTTGLLKLGSLNPAWSGSLYWSATATSASVGSAAFWWDQMIVKRIDGTQTVIGGRAGGGSALVVSGLTPSTSGTSVTYDFYPYIDDILNQIGFLAGPIGSPAYGWADSSLTSDQATTNSQQMNRQDRLGLGPIQILMPIYSGSTTTSGGGGGFGGTCPRGDMKVRLSDGTVIRADEIKPKDKLVTTLEYGILTHVLNVRHETCSEWIEIHTTKGSVIVHPDTHFPVEDSHDFVMAKDLTMSHILKARRGSARITDIRLNIEQHTRVILTCGRSKVFLCGIERPDIVIHNVRLLNC